MATTQRGLVVQFIMVCLSFLVSALSVDALITELQQKQILAIANNARSHTALSAANMKVLRWDDSIAAAMQNYTDGCWLVNRAKDPPTYFLLNDHLRDPVRVATIRMVGMEPLFDFNTGRCYNSTTINQDQIKCRHPEVYGRVIQAGIERIGCGMTAGCTPGVPSLISCGIGRDDDTEVIQPFIPGPRCSQCPTGWNYCVRGLCSKVEGTTEPTKAPTTRKPTVHPTRRPTRPTRTPTSWPTRKTRAPTTVV